MSSDSEMQCYEFVVHFQEELPPLVLPALGQATLMSVLPILLMHASGNTILNFVPASATPEFLQHASKLISEAYPEHFGPQPPASGQIEWFDPEEGWKAASQLARVLTTPSEEQQTVPPPVLAMMKAEVNELLGQLDQAVAQETGFYISLEVSANPPEAVRNWWQDDLAETGAIMRKCLEKNEKAHQP